MPNNIDTRRWHKKVTELFHDNGSNPSIVVLSQMAYAKPRLFISIIVEINGILLVAVFTEHGDVLAWLNPVDLGG